MNYRNPKYTASAAIDVEINHPQFGWILFTADPDDTENFGRDLFAEIETDGGVAAYVPPAPKDSQVDAERDRRLAAGTVVAVSGYGDIAVQGRVQDAVNYLALESKAAKLELQGVTDPVLPFRDRDNVMHTLTPAQVVELIEAGVTHAQSVYAAAWALKDDAGGIPQDYTDDGYWP